MASMSTFSSKQLSEVDLKCLFLRHLREHNVINSNSVIASEYSLGHAGRRVDLAISCDKFIAVEFKSGADTLKRLQPQLDAYLRYFDRVIVVADERHIPGARAQIPSSVELWSVDAEGGLLPLQNSSSKSSRSTRALAQLCSTRQLKRLISAPPSSTLSRSKLVEMAARAPFDLVHAAAIGAFKTSFARSSAAFWNHLATREIDREAMGYLSRTLDTRQKRKTAIEAKSEFWLTWADEAASVFGLPEKRAAATG